MVEQVPIYVKLGIPLLTTQDIELLKTGTQYIIALIAFLLVTMPATARARVQLDIERSRLSQEITLAFEAAWRKDGTVLSGSGQSLKQYDLLSVLNKETLWLPAGPDHPSPLLERGERYRPFVARRP